MYVCIIIILTGPSSLCLPLFQVDPFGPSSIAGTPTQERRGPPPWGAPTSQWNIFKGSPKCTCSL